MVRINFSKIKNTQLIIYNDRSKIILGSIHFTLEIISLKTIFNLIIINFNEQTIIYDILTLSQIKIINNTIMDLYSTIINIKQNKYFIISVLNTHKKQILINALLFEQNNKEEIIETSCNNINSIECDSQSLRVLL